MLVAFPTFVGDIGQLVDLLKWIELLGPCKAHKALIVADAALGYQACLEAKTIADRIFGSTSIICTAKPVHGWPRGANHLFYRAAIDIQKFRKEDWLWLEPDAIPLRAGWLDEIESEYRKCGKPYMGHVYNCSQNGLPPQLMSAIAVYSKDAALDLPMVPDSPKAFDVECASKMVEKGFHTSLIHHLWGEKDNAPRFSDKGVPGTALFDLDSIPKEAVIFHRNKDGSLIRQLKKKMGIPVEPSEPFSKVFIQGGRNGDLILLLPAFKMHFDKTGQKPVVICSQEFSKTLLGASYVKVVPTHYHWWNDMPRMRQFAADRYGGGVVTQCYAHQWGIDLSQWPCFMESMLDRAGLPINRIASEPLIYDNRNKEREATLITKHRHTKRPLLLMNFSGHSSPFHHYNAVLQIVNKFGDKFEIVDLGKIIATRIYDLLGLMEIASGMILTDSSTYHLAHATKTPYIAFLKDGWTGSTVRTSCSLAIRYPDTLNRLHEITPFLERWN